MSRWAWTFGAIATFVLLGARSSALVPAKPRAAPAPAPGAATPDLLAGTCPPGTAPDNDACVHLTVLDEGTAAESRTNTHRERSGRWSTYDQIPRLPERPADYDAYRYPIPPGVAGGHYVVSGYDLDQPDAKQRRAPTLSHVGHGAVDLPQVKGTPVAMIALEHQEGLAEVLYAGTLFGTTVLTRHTLREGGRLRDYLMLLGHLDTIAPGISAGVTVPEGQTVGTVGDSASPRFVHLHLEVRRVRDGVDLGKVPAGAPMIADSVTVVCDPRNVLPLK
ncbi:MAG: peptidoglycan DD-metalloendopeptidase family protein [Labilithrix sp.]|nr:peptidoglycan DD-metalloendopeptidase family protein [Labilithrix sp.]MCW5813844.1 peptidoglycan DD-metalloendopeptidase family protein [Labilithrix sp.]